MIRIFYAVIFLTITVQGIHGQSLQEYLNKVENGNPEINAYKKLLEARRLEARTGNTPADPFISAGVMPGTPEAAGTKKTWSITQSFSFPTKYLLQKKVNRSTIRLAEQEFNQGRLQILLDAKESYYDLAWKMKHLNALVSRKTGYDRLREAWKKMLDNGQTTIMDYNRIMLEISSINLEITKTRADIDILQQKLAYISGAAESNIVPDEYTSEPEPDPEMLLKDKSSLHPAYIIPEIEYQISIEEMKLSKSGSLPEFQLGYESEIEQGETYTGPFGGISIPLWSNSNRIKSASAKSDYMQAQRDASIRKLNLQVTREYLNMKALEKSISDINGILESDGGTKYLNSALDSGEITLASYFTYIEVIYKSEDTLLELENDYYKSLAILHDHELLK
ncbi:MAG TPA: TolC family protein [Bacteroidales bacterium]|nr:TolC family protein [Bacteroidales bacterium]